MMKTSKYKDHQVTPDPEYIAAWEKIEKALRIEVDPDIGMTQSILNTMAIMAEMIVEQEEALREHQRSTGVYDG